ncbi:MAG: hypothetical protein RIR51_1404, partial [Bacteroidota bacterium]
MNQLKKILGILWIALGIVAGYYLFVNQALPLWGKGGNDLVPAIIYTFILMPLVSTSMIIFGYFSL